MIVAKFGGSSVRDAENMKNCAQIIERNPNISLVILSATYNTTNELDFLFSTFLEKGKADEVENLAKDIIQRHQSLSEELLGSNNEVLSELFFEFKEFIQTWDDVTLEDTPKFRDHTLSFGERFSTTLFYEYLKQWKNLEHRRVEFVKSYDYLKTNSDFGNASYIEGSLSRFKTERWDALNDLDPELRKNTLFVAQGYIGSNERNEMTTLGREGSDYSAALFAEAIDAEEVYIWTDVAGVFSCDPRLSDKAKVIDHLSYDQASLMAKYGAKVLYPETMAPLRNKKIKLWVKCTKDAQLRGSLISEQPCSEEGGYSVCIEKRKDGAILTHLGTDLLERPFPIIEKGNGVIRYYIPSKDITSIINQILN
ncbi:MAG: hypothetical protein CME60_03245 [Halobacteriovoraceae bacterium]|nr:hypothetical protein [Halobacteriovoraceae bacterium]